MQYGVIAIVLRKSLQSETFCIRLCQISYTKYENILKKYLYLSFTWICLTAHLHWVKALFDCETLDARFINSQPKESIKNTSSFFDGDLRWLILDLNSNVISLVNCYLEGSSFCVILLIEYMCHDIYSVSRDWNFEQNYSSLLYTRIPENFVYFFIFSNSCSLTCAYNCFYYQQVLTVEICFTNSFYFTNRFDASLSGHTLFVNFLRL